MKKIRRATLRRKKPKAFLEDDEGTPPPRVFDSQVLSSSLGLVSHSTLKRKGGADQHLFKLLNEKNQSSRTLSTLQSSTSSRSRMLLRRRRRDDDDDASSQERVYGARRSTLKELGEEDETFFVRLAITSNAFSKLTGQMSMSFRSAMSRMFAQTENQSEELPSNLELEPEDGEGDDDLVQYEVEEDGHDDDENEKGTGEAAPHI